jgi:hypothetical protein
MIRKFECNNCKHQFEADDANQVQCPNCNSDNVEYAHFHIPPAVWKICGAALLILLLAVVAMKIEWNRPASQDIKQLEDKDTLEYVRDTTYIKETGLALPPVINVGDLTFEDNGYSFDVTVENAPVVKFYYAVLNPYDNKKTVAKSNDGKFKGVPYSTADGGYYDVALFDASTDSLICCVEKTGFIKQKAVTKQMSVEKLQSLINSRDVSLMGVGENDYLSPDYKLNFSGLPNDAINVPTTLGEVFDKLENEIWSSVKVNSVEYDDMNRISVIHLVIKE